MALAAKIPLVLASMDYSKHLIVYGKTVMPTGDLDADLVLIREFYAGVVGRHTERQGEIRIRPSDDEKTVTAADVGGAQASSTTLE